MCLGVMLLAMAAPGTAAAAPRSGPWLQQRAPGVQRVAYVLEVDLARARGAGWSREEASETRVVDVAAGIVQRRLAAMERSFNLQVEPERRRIEVVMPQIQPRDRELFEQLLASLGRCEFLRVADEELAGKAGIDLERERECVDAWRAANPGTPLEVFHERDPADGGPDRRLLWVEAPLGSDSGTAPDAPPLALFLPAKPEDHFGAGCFAGSALAQDAHGYPAVAYELLASRGEDFARFTEAWLDRRLAILIDGKIRSAPTLNAVLPVKGLIEGRFGKEECERFVSMLANPAGPLRVVEIR